MTPPGPPPRISPEPYGFVTRVRRLRQGGVATSLCTRLWWQVAAPRPHTMHIVVVTIADLRRFRNVMVYLSSRAAPRALLRMGVVGVERLASHVDDCSLPIRLCQLPGAVFTITPNDPTPQHTTFGAIAPQHTRSAAAHQPRSTPPAPQHTSPRSPTLHALMR